MVAYTKPKQRGKKRAKGEEERDQIKFIDLRSERLESCKKFRKASRRQDRNYMFYG